MIKWFKSEGTAWDAVPRPGLAAAREIELLTEWHARG